MLWESRKWRDKIRAVSEEAERVFSPESGTEIFDHLFDQVRDMGGKFHERRRAVLGAIKIGVEAVYLGYSDAVDHAFQVEIPDARRKFNELNVPQWMKEQNDLLFDQEIVEFCFVASFWPYISGKSDYVEGLPGSKESIGVNTDQAWITGLMDVPGEIAKMVSEYLFKNPELTPDQQKEILERQLVVGRGIEAYLEPFTNLPPNVLKVDFYPRAPSFQKNLYHRVTKINNGIQNALKALQRSQNAHKEILDTIENLSEYKYNPEVPGEEQEEEESPAKVRTYYGPGPIPIT